MKVDRLPGYQAAAALFWPGGQPGRDATAISTP